VGADFDTGQRFGAYLLGKLIGRGGMGVVYSAEHVHLGRTVALKLLAPELSTNEDFRARFLRESRLAATLDHPSVVTVYDAGDVNGVLYIAMRFVRGTDLAGVISQRGPMPAGETMSILEQVADALDAAHDAGLVHRDVKPANVMIEGDRCYLTDFGLTKHTAAESTQALTMAGQFLGTLAYVSPEQIEGRDLDGRADEYALGCVLHECLTGSRPYPRDSELAVIYAQLRDPPPRPTELRPDLPPAIDAVLARAMAKNPEDRYASCSEMVAAAGVALADVPTRPTAAPEPTFDLVTELHPPPTAPAEPEPATAPLEPPAAPPEPPAAPPDPPTRPLAPEPQRTGVTSPLGFDPAIPPAVRGGPAYPPPTARSRNRLVLPLLLLALLVGAGVVAVIVASGGDSGKNASSSSGGSSGNSGGKTGGPHVVGKPIRVGDKPLGVVIGGDKLFVANRGSSSVTRVDLDGGSRKDIPVGASPYAVAPSDDSVWVTSEEEGTVTPIDPASGEPGDPITVGSKPSFLGARGNDVWVVNSGDGTLSVIDASAGAPAGDAIEIGGEPSGFAASKHSLWVADRAGGTVTQITDGKLVDEVDVGKQPADMSFGADAIWVANEGSDTVSRIVAPSSGLEVTSAKVGDAPVGMAFGEGYAWVANSGDDSVMRLDTQTGKPVGDPIHVPGNPSGITASHGSVWVTSYDAGTLTRIVP
jgi:serine/threonine-protein kinase